MPKVQYHCKVRNIRMDATMPTPKRITELKYWFKEARKALSVIPQVDHGEYIIEHQTADKDYVRFDLIDAKGIKSNVVIQRNYSAMVR